jgi:hypothetical protein
MRKFQDQTRSRYLDRPALSPKGPFLADAGRYLAEHIRSAKFVVLPGDDDVFFVGDTDALVDEIEEFLTGACSGAEGEVLTMTMLFIDIVASTVHQARGRPTEWSRLTDRCDAMVRAALLRHRVTTSRRRGMASWPPSMPPGGRCSARPRYWPVPKTSDWSCGRESTLVRSS